MDIISRNGEGRVDRCSLYTGQGWGNGSEGNIADILSL